MKIGNAVLLIKRDGNNKLTARCCFIGNNEFKMECKFIDVQYDSIAKRINIIDSDSDTLIFTLDKKSKMLTGGVHTEDEINPVNFVRTEKDYTFLKTIIPSRKAVRMGHWLLSIRF